MEEYITKQYNYKVKAIVIIYLRQYFQGIVKIHVQGGGRKTLSALVEENFEAGCVVV